MTSAEIRQSFLDFFKSKGHTIVPSSSLMPDSPGLLFTNAGMNQFVPIFLNERAPDVDKWPHAIPGKPTRAADTQKCIRAGGKHNDLEDVGLDTYHHTFFEMLGNWSFGDYFKKEAIEWGWELVAEIWKFPKHRLYATVYCPDKSKGDPSDFDQEAYDFWAAKFIAAGLDPKVHIVNGGKKDNFWMMGETGPCGPCSELHVDLTPAGDTKGSLVNKGDARCIEIWNLVFIQFNANPDGTFSPLPAKHVDTGMGFERVTSIIQGTKGFKDFANAKISNYETDIFRPIFDKLEHMSGKKYGATLAAFGTWHATLEEKADIAFRVIGDHIRTLSFSIADGILPGNNERNYVLRRVLRRAALFGGWLGFKEPFLYNLVDTLTVTMGSVFPEIVRRQEFIKETIHAEEVSFQRTCGIGQKIFDEIIESQMQSFEAAHSAIAKAGSFSGDLPLNPTSGNRLLLDLPKPGSKLWHLFPDALQRALTTAWSASTIDQTKSALQAVKDEAKVLSAAAMFILYDTYGFPPEETERLAKDQGFKQDREAYDRLMDEQRARARAAQKKEIIAASNINTSRSTHFVGFDQLSAAATVLDAVNVKDKIAVTLDVSPLYAEMGGQVGDTGEIQANGKIWHVVNTQKMGNTFLHFVADKDAPAAGAKVELRVEEPRRSAIQRHHTVTHLLHWALHEVASPDATQKGSYVGPDKLTFDFSSAALTPAQIADVEKLVNERIVENAGVSWSEVPYAAVKGRKEIMQFFGEKYGDVVRVVQIGGRAAGLDGYSMELCGGTHTRATGEIGLFRILSESAVAAGIRRIEAVAGLRAYDKSREDAALITLLAGKINSPVGEIEKKLESLLGHQKELEKQLKAAQQKEASDLARTLIAKAKAQAIIENLGAADGDFLQAVADALKSQFKGVVVLGGAGHGAVSLVATVSSDFTAKFQAGKIIQAIAPIVGGKGGGKPDNARGGGKDVAKINEALAKAREMVEASK